MVASGFNEYGALKTVALRVPRHAFQSPAKVAAEWQLLRFHSAPDYQTAVHEHAAFVTILAKAGADIVPLGNATGLTLDAIYTRDAILISPKGLILCRMGRESRRAEPKACADELERLGYQVAGQIEAPGSLEGGDIIWLDEHALAVGEGPRTNAGGIAQLSSILGPEVTVHTVPLPQPDHPEDVFHLMSMISPLDRDLALIYRPLMPTSFLEWLEAKGIGFIEVPDHEYTAMGCNVLALGPRDVLMLDHLPETKSRLEVAGCRVQTYKGDEISHKGEGGPTCLTRPLVRGA